MRLINLFSVFLVITIFIQCSSKNEQELKLPAIFTDHMVLQRGENIKIWGQASPGEDITISINDQERTTVANPNGKFELRLKPMKAGGPYTFVVEGEEKKLKFKDVLVGEVWLCSGQSNMAFSLNNAKSADTATPKAEYPGIRLFKVKHNMLFKPAEDFDNPGWYACRPDTVGSFSAVAYFYGNKLHKELNVPIGLIQSAWGGSFIEAWIQHDSLNNYTDFKNITNTINNSSVKNTAFFGEGLLQQEYETQLDQWKSKIDTVLEEYKQTCTYERQSSSMQLPTLWENAGLKNTDGIVCFRKSLMLPDHWKGKDLTLKAGYIDDLDMTWINGNLLGNHKMYNELREYNIPAEHLQEGINHIDIKVFDLGGGGGIYGSPDRMTLICGDDSISLAGEWNYHLITKYLDFPGMPQQAHPQHVPCALFNGMINPLTPYGIRGAIWYQGESNADRPLLYRSLLQTMINNWRAAFEKDTFPFIIVQLPNWHHEKWPELREAQFMASRLPKTYITNIIDLGDPNDIHPTNKQPVGNRLAKTAMANVYNKAITWSGPVCESMEIKGNKAIINFNHVDGGLIAEDGAPLKSFTMAGRDKKFYRADATIKGNKVVVFSEEVDKPAAVRYAWAGNPDCNLYNQAGFPAFPFRTDQWDNKKEDPLNSQLETIKVLLE